MIAQVRTLLKDRRAAGFRELLIDSGLDRGMLEAVLAFLVRRGDVVETTVAGLGLDAPSDSPSDVDGVAAPARPGCPGGCYGCALARSSRTGPDCAATGHSAVGRRGRRRPSRSGSPLGTLEGATRERVYVWSGVPPVVMDGCDTHTQL